MLNHQNGGGWLFASKSGEKAVYFCDRMTGFYVYANHEYGIDSKASTLISNFQSITFSSAHSTWFCEE